MKEHFYLKISTGLSYTGMALGFITQNHLNLLSACSYIIGITLGVITIYCKLDSHFKNKKDV
jgi:hypothetical protein